jgi:hypothetical protein
MPPLAIGTKIDSAAKTLAALLVFTLACACSQTVRVTSEVDPQASFPRRATYAWMASPEEQRVDPRRNSELLQWRVQTAVDAQLARRGWNRGDSESVDLLLQFQLQLRERTADTFSDYYWYRRTGGSGGPQEAYVLGYLEGRLVIELFEARTGRRLWRSTATAPVERPDEPQNLLDALPSMLSRLP